MSNHVKDKVIIVTGAASGFGRLVSEKTANLGAKVVCADINAAQLDAVTSAIVAAGGASEAVVTDVTQLEQMNALAQRAVQRFGRIDVLVNNAGVMPLAFYADHAQASAAWSRCIDINIKGVLNGIIAVHDVMIAQGRGHIVNLSSIYGNFPVVGAGVYGASKAAVNFLSESLRMESQGKIKVTIVKPTGVPGTGLGNGHRQPGGDRRHPRSQRAALSADDAGTRGRRIAAGIFRSGPHRVLRTRTTVPGRSDRVCDQSALGRVDRRHHGARVGRRIHPVAGNWPCRKRPSIRSDSERSATNSFMQSRSGCGSDDSC